MNSVSKDMTSKIHEKHHIRIMSLVKLQSVVAVTH